MLFRSVPKTMVIPEERERDFERKMKSPLFSEHFNNDGWTLLYFGAFRQAFTQTKAKTAVESLFGKKKAAAEKSEQNKVAEEAPQLSLFVQSETAAEEATSRVAEEPIMG